MGALTTWPFSCDGAKGGGRGGVTLGGLPPLTDYSSWPYATGP